MFVISYWFGSILLVVLLRPLEEERLGGAGFLPAEPEPSVEALDVGEDALPVGLLHPHHVLHVEQGADVAVLPEVATKSLTLTQPLTETRGNLLCHVESQGEVVPPVPRVELVKFEGLRVEVVDERAEGDAVVPARREVGHVHILEDVDHNKGDSISGTSSTLTS